MSSTKSDRVRPIEFRPNLKDDGRPRKEPSTILPMPMCFICSRRLGIGVELETLDNRQVHGDCARQWRAEVNGRG